MSALIREKLGPYLGAAIALAGWYYGLHAVFPPKPDNLMLATGTASAVLIGFLATAKAIVLGLTNSPLFHALKETGYHKILFRYFFEAVVAGTLLLVVSVAGFFFKEGDMPLWFDVCWVAIAITAMLNYLRIVSVLFKLIEKA